MSAPDPSTTRVGLGPSPEVPRPSLRARLDALFAEYGPVAFTVYFVIFGGTWVGFGVALALGVQVGSVTGSAGILGASYLATKLTQPLRIGATLVLTPIVGTVVSRRRRRPQLGTPNPSASNPSAPNPSAPNDDQNSPLEA